jgi:hypothetical protein
MMKRILSAADHISAKVDQTSIQVELLNRK